jgi:drug/metabolite transporter (DMT)-like permease
MTVQTSDPRGLALVVLSACAYGIGPPMARLAYDAGADVLTANTARFVAGVCGIALLLWLGRIATRLPSRANWGSLGLGLISTVTSLGYLGSISFIPASLAVLIFYVFPLLVALGATWTEGEPLTWTKVGGLAVAFVGLGLALGVSFGQLDARGVALAAIAAVGAAAHMLAVSKVARWAGGATLPLNLRSMSVGLIITGVLLAWAGGPSWPAGGVGWTGLVGTMLCFTMGITLMYAAIARLGPVRTAIVLNLEPLVAIVASVLLLGEHFGLQQVAGAALVLGAVMWVQLRRLA